MELRDIITNYCAHLRDNFHPVEDPQHADLMLTTSDIVCEIEQHFGELGSEENPFDKSFLVQQLSDIGFKYIMLPQTTELRWLLSIKK